MADAFALSPISARASMPTEADYEAICGAFMETARGRWFLGEYAKRNRNADTGAVLDAVARIEAVLASQKAAVRDSLAERLPDIAELIAEACGAVLDALPKNDMRPATEPIQRAAGILRDVAWTMRESGADTRVCDLLDVQAKAIVDGCTRMHGDPATQDASAAITAVLDALTRQISALARGEMPTRTRRAPRPVEAPPADIAARDEIPPAEPVASPVATGDVVVPDAPPAVDVQHADEPLESAQGEVQQDAASEQQDAARDVATPLTPVEIDAQTNLVEDLEITEIDPDEQVPDDPAAKEPVLSATATPMSERDSEPDAASEEPPPVVDEPATPEVAAHEPAAQETEAEETVVQLVAVAAEPEVVQKPAPASLGRAALESGVVTPLRSRYSEALAPIRRMSQAEKIAFFS